MIVRQHKSHCLFRVLNLTQAILFALLISTVFSSELQAQREVIIDGSSPEFNFMPQDLELLVDSTNTLTFQDIRQLEKAGFRCTKPLFTRQAGYQNADFRKNAGYWIRMAVRITESANDPWLLEFYDQTIDRLDIWIPQADGTYTHNMTGDQISFSEKTIRHKNFEVPLTSRKDSVLVYYFRVQSHEFADLRIALRSVNRFIYYALNEYILFGMFYGMIFIISLYNVLVYAAIREIKHIYYVCYILSVGGYALALDGIGFQYLWPGKPEWNLYAGGTFLFLVIFWALVFTRQFLNTRRQAPGLDRWLRIMMIIRTITFIVELVAFPDWLTYRTPDILPLSLIFFTSIQVWRGGYKPARFFVLAYGILFIGFLLRSLVSFNVLPFTLLTHYSLHLSFVVEMLLLTFALGDRIRILKAMRDRAHRRIISQHESNMQLKDTINRELEIKVSDRTRELDAKNRELEDKNIQLTSQAEKINKINALLDLDNWKLKRQIREVLNERLHEHVLSYDEFRTLYPDAMGCYRFLENLKWANNYHCRKCDNEKFISGKPDSEASRFSRRCTRCGYQESITAFTLFHSLKFPVEKAFYLTYLTVAGSKEQHTLEETAVSLNLSPNTVWSFRSKVNGRLLTLRTKGPVAWETVILDQPAPSHPSQVPALNHQLP